MISQSENNIKKSALQFLKIYYKHRPRTGETKLKVDQITQDGVIADGLISFPQNETADFIASVEATSFETRNEVKYKTLSDFLMWDSLMWGTTVVALTCLLGHYFHWFTFAHHQWELVMFLGSLFGIVVLGHHYFFKNRTKYRYIYALQQFKQYHADEQWVAIGDNVFYGPKDPSFSELKKQCVKNGFGLLSIDKELATHLVISPSREQVFGSSRKVLSFIGMEDVVTGTTIEKAKGFWNFIKSKLGISSKAGSLGRYQRFYYRPLFTSLLMIGLIGFVAYEDLRDKDMIYVKDEFQYDKVQEEIAKSRPKSEFDVKIDSQYIQSKQSKIPDSYIAIAEDNKRTGTILSKKQPLAKRDILTAKGGETKILIHTANKAFTGYDCERFNFLGKNYAVQDGSFESLEIAERRIELLKRSGIKANLFWLGCLNEKQNEYMVFVDMIYPTKDDAIRYGNDYRKLLKQKNIPEKKLRIRTLEKG